MQSGYLYAVERGYDVTVQMDGDGQHDPAYLRALVQPVLDGRLDMAIGSRFITKDGFQSSALRRLGINIISLFIRLLTGKRVRDTTSGFRACNRALTEFYARHYAQDYPEPEAIVAALAAGYQMCIRDRSMDSIFKDKTLLITGGTGSFGNTVLKHCLLYTSRCV